MRDGGIHWILLAGLAVASAVLVGGLSYAGRGVDCAVESCTLYTLGLLVGLALVALVGGLVTGRASPKLTSRWLDWRISIAVSVPAGVTLSGLLWVSESNREDAIAYATMALSIMGIVGTLVAYLLVRGGRYLGRRITRKEGRGEPPQGS